MLARRTKVSAFILHNGNMVRRCVYADTVNRFLKRYPDLKVYIYCRVGDRVYPGITREEFLQLSRELT